MIRTYRASSFFLFLSLGFYLRDFATHSDGVSPAGVWRYILLYIMDCILFCIIIIVLFIQCLIYSIHLAFRTHVWSCVRGGINHPKSILLFLGV
jgi:hypothetical protein